jgi:hypothetical protein
MFPAEGGEAALEMWRCLRELVSETHHWPILLGDAEGVSGLRKMQECHTSVAYILTTAESLEGTDILEARERERREEFEEYNPGENIDSYMPKDGEWPKKKQPAMPFTIPYDILTRKPHREVYIALAPTERCWDAPAFVSFGGWNECPEPAEHVAMMKYWNQNYGAEIVGITDAVIEARALRPPRDRQAAMKLARQQYTYCPDIVDQGTETISILAATLLNHTQWYFWWD